MPLSPISNLPNTSLIEFHLSRNETKILKCFPNRREHYRTINSVNEPLHNSSISDFPLNCIQVCGFHRNVLHPPITNLNASAIDGTISSHSKDETRFDVKHQPTETSSHFMYPKIEGVPPTSGFPCVSKMPQGGPPRRLSL